MEHEIAESKRESVHEFNETERLWNNSFALAEISALEMQQQSELAFGGERAQR